MELEFTQYVRPDGHKRNVSVTISDNLKLHVSAIKCLGLVFAAEVLTSGKCSFTIEYPKEGCDFDIELAENGPGPKGTKAAVERLIRRFDREAFMRWKKEIRAADDGLGVGWGT